MLEKEGMISITQYYVKLKEFLEESPKTNQKLSEFWEKKSETLSLISDNYLKNMTKTLKWSIHNSKIMPT